MVALLCAEPRLLPRKRRGGAHRGEMVEDGGVATLAASAAKGRYMQADDERGLGIPVYMFDARV
jgi:hypothetical protein